MIFSRFKRTNFLSEVENANNVIEYDLIQSNWDLFEINRPVKFDSIKYGEIQRPDMISYRLYGLTDYWWIICKVNQIDDLWNDLYVGMDLVVPDVRDIEKYYSKVRKRVRTNV